MAGSVALTYPTAAQSGVMVGSPPPVEARVTLANWQRAPFNRWAFLHTRELIPTANISRGEGEVWQRNEPKRDSSRWRLRTRPMDG